MTFFVTDIVRVNHPDLIVLPKEDNEGVVIQVLAEYVRVAFRYTNGIRTIKTLDKYTVEILKSAESLWEKIMSGDVHTFTFESDSKVMLGELGRAMKMELKRRKIPYVKTGGKHKVTFIVNTPEAKFDSREADDEPVEVKSEKECLDF